jgi:hypothetical protein
VQIIFKVMMMNLHAGIERSPTTTDNVKRKYYWLNVQIPHTEMEKPLIGSPVSVIGISYER